MRNPSVLDGIVALVGSRGTAEVFANSSKKLGSLCIPAVLIVMHTGVAVAETEFGGIWTPVHEIAENWDAAKSSFTSRGAELAASYDRRRQDSVLFCMPFGTPRNMLATAAHSIEILQRPEQITMIFDGRGDVRRIYLDGREHPSDPVPNWMGHSIGAWEDETLSIDTVAMTAESRLTADGLPHSDAMRLYETWRLVDRGDEILLRASLVIDDPEIYTSPLTSTRYFRRTPHAMLGETPALCLLDQWRSYLERHSKEQSMQLRRLTNPGVDAGE